MSRKLWEATLGIKCHGVEEVVEQKVKTAFLPLKDTEVELLEATSPKARSLSLSKPREKVSTTWQ